MIIKYHGVFLSNNEIKVLFHGIDEE